MASHRVVILVNPGVEIFCVASPLQVFRYVPERRYQVSVCALAPGPVFDRFGLSVMVEHGLEALQQADTVLVTGTKECRLDIDERITAALRDAHQRGARIASLCTGAFVLAASGLLDGRHATTHWACADYLAKSYPKVKVDPGVLYVDEGQVLSGAGVTATVDLCLYLVRKDHGQQVANQVARMIVASPHRNGGQAQFIDYPMPTQRSRDLGKTRQWMLENLARDLRIDDMAAHAGLAPRSFARRFEAEMGITPLQWLIEQRIKQAQNLLESTGLPVDVVADRCGFGSAVALRQHFKRVAQVTPTDYRKAFSVSLPA